MSFDPATAKPDADAVMTRASGELDSILAELCAALQPFPSFMGHATLNAVEIEDAPEIIAAAGAADPDVGCVVVCPDGGLYELVMRMTLDQSDEVGLDSEGELKLLDVPPAARALIGYAAVQILARLVLERGG